MAEINIKVGFPPSLAMNLAPWSATLQLEIVLITVKWVTSSEKGLISALH